MATKATSLYLSMLGVFGVGLWVILTMGSSFQAPTDLAGRWELRASENAAAADPGQELRIEQSGRFFWLTVDGRTHSLRLESERLTRSSPGCEMRLVGEGVEVVMRGAADADEMLVQGQGAMSGQWIAVRVHRAHPTRGRGAPATRPA